MTSGQVEFVSITRLRKRYIKLKVERMNIEVYGMSREIITWMVEDQENKLRKAKAAAANRAVRRLPLNEQ